MTYESWRITYQDSEQAARAAYKMYMNADRKAAMNANEAGDPLERAEKAEAEVERLRALCADQQNAIRWLAKYQHDLNDLRYKLMAMGDEDCPVREGLVVLWPMVQGIRSNIMLADIGDQPIDCDSAFRAFKQLAAGRGEGEGCARNGSDS